MCIQKDTMYVQENILNQLIQNAIDYPTDEDISFIRSLWDNESWESIVRKYNTEGSVWVCWWYDGVASLGYK